MHHSVNKIKKQLHILILIIILFIPQIGYSSNTMMNFLPMEDALSTSRNDVVSEKIEVKPYREVVKFEKQPTQKINLGNIDIYAFIMLAIVFFIINRRNSKSRKINL